MMAARSRLAAHGRGVLTVELQLHGFHGSRGSLRVAYVHLLAAIQDYFGRRTTTLPVTAAVSPFQDFAVTVTRYAPGLAG
jgi:hypothetical protein